MVAKKPECEAIVAGGERCRARTMRDIPFCFWHNPDTAQEATDARRLGGLRRRREGAVVGAYELDGLTDVPGLRRVLEIAAVDVLALENSVSRVRALIAIALAGARLLEVGELEDRLAALEAIAGPRLEALRSRR